MGLIQNIHLPESAPHDILGLDMVFSSGFPVLQEECRN
jgi:hypothetical protein